MTPTNRSLRLLADDVFKLVMGDSYHRVWPVEHLRAWEKFDEACTAVERDAQRWRSATGAYELEATCKHRVHPYRCTQGCDPFADGAVPVHKPQHSVMEPDDSPQAPLE